MIAEFSAISHEYLSPQKQADHLFLKSSQDLVTLFVQPEEHHDDATLSFPKSAYVGTLQALTDLLDDDHGKTILPGGTLEVWIDNRPCTLRLSREGEISFLYENKIIGIERVRVGNVGSYELAADLCPSWMILNKTKRRQLEKLKEIKNEGLPARGIASLTYTAAWITVGYVYYPGEHEVIKTPITYHIPLSLHAVKKIVTEGGAWTKVEIFKTDFQSAITYLLQLPDDLLSPGYKEFVSEYLHSIILHTRLENH